MVQKGRGPPAREARQQAARARGRSAGSFAVSLAEAFLTRPGAARLKKIGILRHLITTELIQRWADRPIDDISRAEVIAAINAIVPAWRAGAGCDLLLLYPRALFNWAGADPGLMERSPMTGLSATALCGERTPPTTHSER